MKTNEVKKRAQYKGSVKEESQPGKSKNASADAVVHNFKNHVLAGEE